MKYDADTLKQLRDTSLDKSLLIDVVKDICKDMLLVIQSQIADASTSRFNVLQARHLIEDAFEAFDENTGLALGRLFAKQENRFRNEVKSARDISTFFANVLDLPNVLSDSPIEALLERERLVEKALDREIVRFLDVQSRNKSPIQEIETVIATKSDRITRELLEDLCIKTNLKSAIPILAIFKAVEQGNPEIFWKKFEKSIVGLPIEDPLSATDLKKIRKAKKEPLDVARIVMASRGNLLICKPKTSSFVAVPEPLAKLVTNVPGVDVNEDRAIVFVADPERKVGSLLQIRLYGPPTRISTFDLECEDDSRTFNYISSERDTQGNILLTWGLHVEGKPQWVNHACVLESALVEEGHARKQAPPQKMAFEDFGDPEERLQGDLSQVRFDFRDHGNTLSALNEKPGSSTIVCGSSIIGHLPFNVNAVYGQPLAFVVIKDGNEVARYRVLNGELVLQDTIQMQEVSYEITSVCVV